MTVRFQTLTSRVVLVVGLLITICFVLLYQSRATAASPSYSITMTPSSTELSASPGGTTSASFSVINEGSTDYNMAVSVAPYHVVGDNYNPEFTVLPGTTDASQWVHLSAPNTQNLAAGKLQNISYSLDVPAGTAPGGYYAVIFAEAIPPSSSGVTALNRVGDILYITVNGYVVQRGSITPAKLSHIFLGKSLALGLLVQDTGGLHFLTNVHITATSLFGRTAFQANLQRYVLPQTQRLVTTSWAHLPLFGIYKISRSATVVGKVQSLPVQWVIIIRPWLLICISVGLLCAVALAILQPRKRHHQKLQKQLGEKPDVRS